MTSAVLCELRYKTFKGRSEDRERRDVPSLLKWLI
jgi:hypothetical protein